jgi:hypothetical protein
VVQTNDRFSLDRLVLRTNQSERLVRSSSEEQRLQAAILGERLGNQRFLNGRSSRWKRVVGIGAATLIGALVGLGFKLLKG